ncbi:MAG: class I SAM-dependent methyltransferase [Saprospiraceae bacterium]|nr:class I SAM-dependent methyltransferase [Saprospiraceae bacterium]
MKVFWSLALMICLWNCQSSRGQQIGKHDEFEDRLLQMYLPQAHQDSLLLKEQLESLRQAIRQSDLDASSQFDLWFYLNQFNQTAAFPQIIPGDQQFKKDLAQFLTATEHSTLTQAATLAYFRQTYLEHLFNPPSRDRPFYQLNKQADLLGELMAYPFAEVNSLLEIGAGDGGFGLLLQLLFEIDQLYLNELDSNRLISMERQIQLLPKELPRPTIIQGSIDGIGLQEQMVEAVLIRNSLHHFEDPEPMLTDIKRHLVPGGRLYIFEEIRDPISGHQHCEKAMTEDEIRFLLQIEGYRWVQDYPLAADWQKVMVFEPEGLEN